MNIRKDTRLRSDLVDGDYDHQNLHREGRDQHHDRKLAREDVHHRVEAENNVESGRRNNVGRESSFYGGLGDSQGREYERQSGYRESYRKIGEGHLSGNEAQSFPNYGKGTHRGKGPQSYRRTETRILEDVNECLFEHPELDAREITVTMEDGDVVLSGAVADRRSKRLAAHLCEEVRGVRNVQNRLRVTPAIGNGMSIGS